ncbi:iron-siderophore ABC transporter substrate-binding protein [Agromyces aureus]|uniref:ABC transporter substrate-binding protein n=1 Tax=Agromyces aureus TaxID=453304 RepID=A0A191WHF2_9MICO|nr:iron-siderophore ABC transporter substrate-binding protein [Agromyces aureus]ANJ27603.1 ABC transporter substrate-binding protein [Agromyces aureus]
MRLRRPLIAVAGLAAAALALTACASGTPEESTSASDSAVGTGFPITIEHAFGETVIEAAPERVATWGWGSTEAAISVGVYPVAVAEQSWTVGEGNLLPWVEEAYDAAGVEHPVVINDDEGGATIPYEEFIEAAPDLIVAPYSGLTEEQYDTLSDIAPVVAYPEAPWTTPWDDTISITATALGREAEGEAVLDEIDGYLADEAAKHPEFAGKTFAGIWDGDGLVYVYTGADPRIAILTELGLEVAPSVAELDTSDGGFFYELSYEQLDKLDADFIVNYSNSKEEAEALLTKPETQAIPAVAAGKVAQVYDPVTVSSVSPPTALSFKWEGGMPTLIDSIAGVLAE